MNQPPDNETPDDNPFRGPALVQEPVHTERLKHSRLGVFSFLTGILGVAIMLVIFTIIASAILAFAPGEQNFAGGLLPVLVICTLAAAASAIASIVLGVACLTQKDCNRLLGIVGLILGSVLAVALSSLSVIGFLG